MKIIITPPTAETPLDDMLVEITKAIAKKNPDLVTHGCLGGAFGYGADYENDVFMMHHYCWCGSEDCPWCGGCACESGDDKCAWCKGEHRWADKGALRPAEPPHQAAPNFWHKPSGLRVWWYKWIGRGMEVAHARANLTQVFQQCVDSI